MFQLFYYLCANALNNLLLRREYCHWTKGMQIRFNLSHLEQWARENKIQVRHLTLCLKKFLLLFRVNIIIKSVLL